jgi:hypothetical protein
MMERHIARAAPARPTRDAPGAARHAVRRSWAFDFVGHLSAIVAILPVAQSAARAMLPPGLDLAAQDVMPGDRHPIVLILGRQSGVRARLLPFGADYLEFILAMPFVERRAGGDRIGGPFCYPARLYLDRGLPTLAGRLLYAYDKRRAAIRATSDRYRIAAPGGGEPLLEQPVISRSGSGWRYSVVDLGLERAVLQPVALDLAIRRAFVPGVPIGEFRLAGLGGTAGSAFRIRTHWRLAGPWARSSPPASAAPQT